MCWLSNTVVGPDEYSTSEARIELMMSFGEAKKQLKSFLVYFIKFYIVGEN